MTETIFEDAWTLCQHENNKCKRRGKCWRYQHQGRDSMWEADYYGEFGQFCHHFIALTAGNMLETKDC